MAARKLTLAVLLALLMPLAAHAGDASRVQRGVADATRLTTPTFLIQGRGWGHGIGLSQYGAYGMARAGYSYQRILAHYYRGTTLGPAPVARVRILLAAGRSSLAVSSTAPFRVRDASGTLYDLAAGRVTLRPDLKVRVDGEPQAKRLRGPLMFLAGSAPLALDRSYRGSIHVSVVSGKLQAVNHVGLEQYLYGVVPAEVPHRWPGEALKAQAVVARSYALSHMKTGAFDLYADTRSQVYRGIAEEEPETNAAVNATAGHVVLYQGTVASTYYHSTSGGRTASIEDVWPAAKPVPYLVSVPDPHDSHSPYHSWGPFTFSRARLGRVLRVPGRLVDVRATVNASRRVTALTGIGTRGEGPSVDVTAFRRALELRSAWFTVGVLALERPEQAMTYGSRSVLRGIVRGLPKVALEKRSAGEPWTAAGTIAAGADGAFAVRVRPARTTAYRLVVGETRSAPVRVAVAPLVKFSAAKAGTALRGVVRPAVAGERVQVQRLRGPAWKTVATAGVDDAGRFEATLELRPGSYRARVAPAHGLAAGTSAVLTVSPA